MDSVGLVTFSLILCPAFCRHPWEQRFVEQHTLTGIPLEVIRSNPGKNVALAPFAFRYPLCKLANAATGETRQELMSVLVMNDPKDTLTCFSDVFTDISRIMESDLTLFNKIYLNYTDDVKKQFLSDSGRYGVTVSKIGFNNPQAAVSFINREFDSKTYKRLRDVLEPTDIDDNSSIVLVNGVHIRPTWEPNSFDVKLTTLQFFHQQANKSVQVQMMNSVQQCKYLDDSNEDFTAVLINLVNNGLSIMFIVPHPTVSIDSLIATLSQSPDTLEKIRKRMKPATVSVQLPRFKIKAGLDWTDYLRLIGLNRTLSNTNTDLNRILNKNTNYNMYLSKAKQKVFVDIDEMGTYRPNLKERGHAVQPYSRELPTDFSNSGLPEFVADKPFFFCISMVAEKGVVIELVTGVYHGPEA